MAWTVLSAADANCSVEDFFAGVDVWMKRPQVVNRRLLGAIILREHVLDSKHPVEGHGGEWQWAYQLHGEMQGSTKQGDQLYGIAGGDLDSTAIGLGVGKQEETHDQELEHVTCLVRELLPKMKNMPSVQDNILVGNEWGDIILISSLTLCHFISSHLISFRPEELHSYVLSSALCQPKWVSFHSMWLLQVSVLLR